MLLDRTDRSRLSLLTLFIYFLTISPLLAIESWETIKAGLIKHYAGFKDEIRTLSITEVTNTDMSALGMGEGKMDIDTKIFLKGSKSRIETNLFGVSTVIVNDGKTFSSKSASYQNSSANWWDMLDAYNGILESEENVSGEDCYKIRLESKTKKNSGLTAVWLGKDTMFMLKAAGVSDGKEYTVVNSKLKKISGDYYWPYERKIYFDGKLFSSSHVTELNINEELSDDLFVKDDGPYSFGESANDEEALNRIQSMFSTEEVSPEESEEFIQALEMMKKMRQSRSGSGQDMYKNPEFIKKLEELKELQYNKDNGD